MNASKGNDFISSIEIIEQTGISRATLNNYIKMGIIDKPLIKRPENTQKKTKRIGFFSRDVLDRISRVKQLKKEGRTMEEISNAFKMTEGSEIFEEQYEVGASQQESQKKSEAKIVSIGEKRSEFNLQESDKRQNELRLSINDINCPAYLVDNNFQIFWINQQAEEKIFKKEVHSISDAGSRNIFGLFREMGLLDEDEEESSQDLIAFHLRYIKEKHGSELPDEYFMGFPEPTIAKYKKMYESIQLDLKETSLKSLVKFANSEGLFSSYQIYCVTFREGILFLYAPVEGMLQGVVELLSSRSRLINEILKNRMPTLVSFCVLVADLQNSVRICAELPSREYFELINQIWKNMERIFKKYYGTYGKHTGDGMVYYFLQDKRSNYIMNAITCAVELRDAMKKLSVEWKVRKGWFHDLYLNIGINEGHEYFGTIPAAPNVEFSALGDSVNYACRLSDFAQDGAVWTTKNLINLLTDKEYEKLRYGVRKGVPGSEFILEKTFARIMDIVSLGEAEYRKYADIATLPVTEVLEIINDKDPCYQF